MNMLIIGATSAIAEATARRFARTGARLHLVARNAERLEYLARDLKVRGAVAVSHALLDVNDFARHREILDEAVRVMNGIDLVLIAHGTLGDQRQCEADFPAALHELNTNAISVISLLTHLANYFESRRSGTIVVLGSVAGDRGRQSNYVYGTAKSAVATFLQGLRNRLCRSGVHVLTVKPGFVDTPMTASFRKGALWTQPEEIAAGLERAIRRKRNVAYLPGYWACIMAVIRAVPEIVFKRLSL